MVPLFVAGAWRCVELQPADEADLQHFYDVNPEYSLAVDGAPPAADAGRETFDALPPAGWPFQRKWILGFRADDDALIGMADLLSSLFVEGVWHIGLFIVATPLHGHGAAEVLYDGLEAWMIERGAEWARLGVVAGNTRAERFWERRGYREVRRRERIPMGRRVNDVRVMVKPLADGDIAEYLHRVARDRPESP